MIAGGLRVEPGSRLLGTAFPVRPTSGTGQASGDRERRVWKAVVLVEDDPVVVFDRYVGQLGRLGIELEDRAAETYPDPSSRPGDRKVEPIPLDHPRSPCELADGNDLFGPYYDAADPVQADNPISCRVQGSVPGRGVDRLSVALTLVTSGPGPSSPRGSSLLVHVEGGIGPESHPSTDPSSGLLSGFVGGLPPAGRPPLPPGPGEPLADEAIDPGSGLVVPAGTWLLAPAVKTPDAPTGGFVAVLGYKGDPQEVLAQLVRRDLHLNDAYAPPTEHVNGRPLTSMGWEEAGGVSVTAWTYPDASGTGYIYLSVGND